MVNYLIITGPSGAGKSTIIDYIIKNDELFKLNVSYTSRLPRKNEINGIHYHFITSENFLKQIQNGFFLEYTNFSGNYYGTAKYDNDKNYIVILDLDVRGTEFFKTQNPDAFFCLVIADKEIIRERLRKRMKASETKVHCENEMESVVTQRVLSVSDFTALKGIEFNDVIVTDKMDEKMILDKSMELIEKPMEDHQKIMRFSMINITEYLNKVHIDKDRAIIENNKHNMYKYRDELNTQIHMTFIENSHSLLKILEVYQYSYDMLNGMSLNKAETKSRHVSKIYCKEFEKATRHFEENMGQYLTSERYLVHESVLDEYFILLTNDMVIIGKQSKENKQIYQLLHALGRGIVEMSSDNNMLKISTTSGIRYEIKGDPEEIDALHTAFKELQSAQDDYQGKDEEEVDEELVEYCLFTNDLGRLRSYLDKMGYSRRLAFKKGKWGQEIFVNSDNESSLDYEKKYVGNKACTLDDDFSEDTTISDVLSKSNDSNSSGESYVYKTCISDDSSERRDKIDNDNSENNKVNGKNNNNISNDKPDADNIRNNVNGKNNNNISNDKPDADNIRNNVFIMKHEFNDLSSKYFAEKYDFVDTDELKMAYELFEDGDAIFEGFVLRRFHANLRKVNKIQRLVGVISDVFDYLEDYVEELEKIATVVGVSFIKQILLIEKLVLILLKFLNKRIFNNLYEMKLSSEAIGRIRERLKFKNYDFEYLIGTFVEEKKRFEKICLEKAKVKIKKEIENIFK